MTTAWEDFRRDTFGEPFNIIHDGADFDSLPSRWQDERALVSRMLRAGLSEGDSVAAQAVGLLAAQRKDISELVAPLREALSAARGTFAVRAVQAMFAVTRDQDLAQPICAVLTGDGSSFEKADAATALNLFEPRAPVVQALVKGVQDGEYLVRRNSAQTLLILAGRHTTIEKVPELWAKIRRDSKPRTWRRAAAELAKPWAT